VTTAIPAVRRVSLVLTLRTRSVHRLPDQLLARSTHNDDSTPGFHPLGTGDRCGQDVSSSGSIRALQDPRARRTRCGPLSQRADMSPRMRRRPSELSDVGRLFRAKLRYLREQERPGRKGETPVPRFSAKGAARSR
jgi:hypothetical protein